MIWSHLRRFNYSYYLSSVVSVRGSRVWYWVAVLLCREGNLLPPSLRMLQRDQPSLDYLERVGDYFFSWSLIPFFSFWKFRWLGFWSQLLRVSSVSIWSVYHLTPQGSCTIFCSSQLWVLHSFHQSWQSVSRCQAVCSMFGSHSGVSISMDGAGEASERKPFEYLSLPLGSRKQIWCPHAFLGGHWRDG